MGTLSLAMIVKDEASRLEACLRSVSGLADQIIIVDTGSSDGTPELAASLGAVVHHFPWSGDFARARNESLRHAAGDWVLILDADEAVDASDHGTIRRVIDQETAPAYRLILRNYFQGGGQTVQGEAVRRNDSTYAQGAGYSHFADGRAVRLCRRLPGLAFEGRIHELLEPWFQARGLEVRDLDAVIHHFGKADPAREAAKKAHYLELARLDAADHPEDGLRQFHVLQQAMVAEAWPVVLESAQACRRLAAPGPVHPLVHLGEGMALQFQQRHTEALACLDRLLAQEPGHAQGWTRRAVSQAALGQLAQARESLRRAIGLQPGFIVPYVNLAELEGQGGDYAAARRALAEGLEASPGDPQLLHARVQLAISFGRLEDAVGEAWTAIRACPEGGQGAWHRLVALQLYQSGASRQAMEMLDMGLTVFPGHPELLRLKTLVSGGGLR